MWSCGVCGKLRCVCMCGRAPWVCVGGLGGGCVCGARGGGGGSLEKQVHLGDEGARPPGITFGGSN